MTESRLIFTYLLNSLLPRVRDIRNGGAAEFLSNLTKMESKDRETY